MSEVVGRVQDLFRMGPEIAGHDRDYVVSPYLLEAWEGDDKTVGDGAHNSIRAFLQLHTSALSHAPAPSAPEMVAILDALAQEGQLQQLARELRDQLEGAGAASIDAPLLAASQAHGDFQDPLAEMGSRHVTFGPPTRHEMPV